MSGDELGGPTERPVARARIVAEEMLRLGGVKEVFWR